MSKKNIYLILFVVVSGICFAQTDTLKNANEISTNTFKKTKTLKLSYIHLSEKTLDELKDELIVWKEKITSIEFNEQTKEFKLIHNHLMEEKELFEILTKYNIKKEDIISYK